MQFAWPPFTYTSRWGINTTILVTQPLLLGRTKAPLELPVRFVCAPLSSLLTLATVRRLSSPSLAVHAAQHYHCPPQCIVLHWAGGNAGSWHNNVWDTAMYSIQSTANSVNTTRTCKALDHSFKISLWKAIKDLIRCFSVLYCNGLFTVGLTGPQRMDHSSFHWRAPWDLGRVEPWIPWQAILLRPTKGPPPPAPWLAWPILPAAAPWVAGRDMGRVSGPSWQAPELLLMQPVNPGTFLHSFKTSCQEPQGAELCIRWCKPPAPPSDLPSPITMLGLRGARLSLQTEEQHLPCTKAGLQLQRNSSHFS